MDLSPLIKIKKSKYFSRQAGLTLVELLIYIGILAVSGALIGGTVYLVSKSQIKNRIENDLSTQMRFIEENLRQKIESARSVNSASGSTLSLAMSDSSKNPTVFSLSGDTLTLQEGTGNIVTLNDATKIKVSSLSFSLTGATGAGISSSDHYAWNDTIGWIDFGCNGCNVVVPTAAGELTGMAYSSNAGWISLNCLSTNSCNSVNYKVSIDDSGKLSGWAWSENYGWISFSCTTGSSSGTNICCAQNPPPCSDYGVTVATSTGEWDGYAWSENLGWISFNCKTGGPTQNDICSTSNYKVKDLRTKTSAIKIDITLNYNDNRPDYALSRSATFVFNLLNATP